MKVKQHLRAMTERLELRTLFAAVNFAPHVDFAVGTTPVALVAADFNSDGNQDVAVADSTTNKVYVYLGNGSGAFIAGPIITLSSPPSTMITGDFNGDGRPDLAVGCTAMAGQIATTVDVVLNTGAGTFGVGQITTVETGASNGEVVTLAAADFNRDGHLDLAVTGYTRETIDILTGNGNGTFAAPMTYQANAHPTAITAADFNNDTYPDLAVTSTVTDTTSGSALTTNTVALLLGSAAGGFSAGPNILLTTSGIPTTVVNANLTSATTPGLIIGDSNGNAAVLTNTGGHFATAAEPILAAGSRAVAVGDFNLDGTTDFVSADGGSSTSSSADSVTVVPGAGSGTVGSATSFSTGAHPADVVVADFNNDGKPDIATANQMAGTVSILLNSTVIPAVATRTTLGASSTSTPAGSALMLTAAIVPSNVSPLNNELVPTGSVNFYDGNTLLATVNVAASQTQAGYSTSSLAVGKHSLRAIYSGDSGYATSTAATIVETITPTATQGPDLVGTFISSTLPTTLAPGESGMVKVLVTNQGNTIASGAISNVIDLSVDASVDSSDATAVVKGTLAKANLHLKPGQSVTLSGSVTIPQNVPLADYSLLISLNASGVLAESISGNNLVVSPAKFAVSDVFGTVAGRRGVALQVADTGGTLGTFRMTGAGSGTIVNSDAGVTLTLSGTGAATSVTLTTPHGQVFHLNDLSADSAVGKLTAPTLSVSHSIALPDGINSVVLGDVDGTITIGGPTAAAVSLGSVRSANLSSAAGIRSLAALNWDQGTVTAPWIGALLSRREFAASLRLSGASAPGGISLNSAAIGQVAGGITSTWTVSGNINRLSAASFAAGSVVNEDGVIKTLSSAGGFAAEILASSLGSISVRGAATAARFSASGTIGVINIRGSVDAATRFIASTFPRRAILGGVAVDPLSDSHFLHPEIG